MDDSSSGDDEALAVALEVKLDGDDDDDDDDDGDDGEESCFSVQSLSLDTLLLLLLLWWSMPGSVAPLMMLDAFELLSSSSMSCEF